MAAAAKASERGGGDSAGHGHSLRYDFIAAGWWWKEGVGRHSRLFPRALCVTSRCSREGGACLPISASADRWIEARGNVTETVTTEWPVNRVEPRIAGPICLMSALTILRHSRIHSGYIGVIGIDQPGLVQRLPVSSYQSTSSVSLPLKRAQIGSSMRKRRAMPGTGREGTRRAMGHETSAIDPTSPVTREHCQAFFPSLPLRFEPG